MEFLENQNQELINKTKENNLGKKISLKIKKKSKKIFHKKPKISSIKIKYIK